MFIKMAEKDIEKENDYLMLEF